MKRGVLWVVLTPLLIVLILMQSLPSLAASEGAVTYEVFLNGERMLIESVVKDGAVYLPVQAIASKLQLAVEWNPGLNVIKINDRLVDAAPIIRNGIIFLPVETIAQSINALVKWDSKKKRVQFDVSPTAKASSGQSGPYTDIKTAPVIPIPKLPAEGTGAKSTQPNTAAVSTQQVTAGTSGIPAMTASSPATGATQVQSGIDSIPYPSSSAYPGSSAPPKNPESEYPAEAFRKKTALATGGMPAESGYYTYPQTTASESLSNSMPGAEPFLQPMHAPPQMPEGLQLPPQGPEYNSDTIKTPSIPAELNTTSNFPAVGNFTPKKVQNKVFSVAVTNMEEMSIIKNFYKPHTGSKYVVVYVSQQNISDKVQVYTGKFSLVDGENRIYEYQESLSNFWLVILRPGSLNFGYLVFEIPDGAIPTKLILHALNQEPLSVNLD